MRIIYLIAIISVLASCKKENKLTETIIGTISIYVRNHSASMKLEKEINLDSIFFKFVNDQVYNCNLYRINCAITKEANNLSFTLGNIYYDAGFCVYGNFPATATYKQKDLQLGKYELVATKNNQNYKGQLTVTNTQYIFDWQHDAILKIEPKTVNK